MSITLPKKQKQRLKKTVKIVAALYILIGIALYMFQEKLLFLPTVLEQDYVYSSAYNFE